jgi:hypothetical protein
MYLLRYVVVNSCTFGRGHIDLVIPLQAFAVVLHAVVTLPVLLLGGLSLLLHGDKIRQGERLKSS